MNKRNLKPLVFDDGYLLASTVVAIKEAKEKLASFSLELKNILKDKGTKLEDQNALYTAEVNLYQVLEEIQVQFVNLLMTKFTSHSKYPNQINDLVEYVNTKLKPNQHEVGVLINESRCLHTLLVNPNFKGNKDEVMDKLLTNNVEVQKISKMNLEDDLIQYIKDNSVAANKINKSLDALYTENKPEINHLKIDKLIKERLFISETSQKHLEKLKEVQHSQPIQKNTLADFNLSNSLYNIETPILARTTELIDILNKIQTIVEDILKTD